MNDRAFLFPRQMKIRRTHSFEPLFVKPTQVASRVGFDGPPQFLNRQSLESVPSSDVAQDTLKLPSANFRESMSQTKKPLL